MGKILTRNTKGGISNVRNRRYELSPCSGMSPIIPFVMGFSEQFPGITPHLLTLASNFKVPFYRELLMAMGIYSVSKASCSNILKAGPGSSITIVVGGAAESLSAHPGTVNLTLRKRCVLPCCEEELAD